MFVKCFSKNRGQLLHIFFKTICAHREKERKSVIARHFYRNHKHPPPHNFTRNFLPHAYAPRVFPHSQSHCIGHCTQIYTCTLNTSLSNSTSHVQRGEIHEYNGRGYYHKHDACVCVCAEFFVFALAEFVKSRARYTYTHVCTRSDGSGARINRFVWHSCRFFSGYEEGRNHNKVNFCCAFSLLAGVYTFTPIRRWNNSSKRSVDKLASYGGMYGCTNGMCNKELCCRTAYGNIKKVRM